MRISRLVSLLLILSILSQPVLVSAADNETDFNSTKTHVNAIQIVNPSLPNVPQQRGRMGEIMSRLFDADGKIGNWYLKALGTRTDGAVLRWNGGNGGQFVQGSIFDTGTNVTIGNQTTIGGTRYDSAGSLITRGTGRELFILQTGDNNADAGIAFRNSGGAYTNAIYRTNIGSNDADLRIAGGDATSSIGSLVDYVTIEGGPSGGNVGIGITDPAFKLDVNGDINFGGDLYKGGVRYTAGGKFYDGTDPLDAVYTDGNVGIGTLVPAQPLDVVGNANISGTLTVGALSGDSITDGTIDDTELADGSVRTQEIANNTIVNADVNSAAAIAGTKISPNFGGQNIITRGDIFLQDGSLDGFQLHARDAFGHDLIQLAPRNTGTTDWTKGITLRRADGFVGIADTTPDEMLTVNGKISVTGDPDSDDDVGDRGYNDSRYINVGESGDSIQDGTIDSSEIQNDTLTAIDLAPDSVGASELADDSVASANIIDGTIVREDIGVNQIYSNHIVNGVILSEDISSDTITAGNLAPNSVASSELAGTLTYTDNVGNASYRSLTIDHNASGADVLTADRIHSGIRVDIDSSATGGDTANEHRVYGFESDVDVTGDSDLVYGGHFDARANHSSGVISSLRGTSGYARVDGSAQVSNAYGAYNLGQASANGTVNYVAGATNKSLKDSGSTNTNAAFIGQEGEVEIDAGTITNAYATRSLIDRDGGTITNGYLFWGDYQGTLPTNAYGVYITDPVNNYFSGNVGIGQTSPNHKLSITADPSAIDVLASDSEEILTSRNDSAGGDPDQFYIRHNFGSVDIGNTRGNINFTSGDVSVSGRLSVTGDPDSGDDVADRDYNDARYLNVGEAINGDVITDGTIDSSEIQNDTLTAADLAADSVGASELADNSVASANIIDGTISAADMGTNSIISASILDGEVTSADINNNTITETDISDSFVARNSQLLDGIDSANFLRSDTDDTMNGNINFNRATGLNLMSWAGGFMKRKTNQGGFTLGSDSSVMLHAGDNTDNLANDVGMNAASTTENLYLTADNEVRIISGRQTDYASSKIFTFSAGGNVSFPGNLSLGGTLGGDSITDGTVDSSEIQNNTLTNADIADGTVRTQEITDGTIVNADINGSAAIAGTKISPNFGNQAIENTQHVSIGDGRYYGFGDDSTRIEGNSSSDYIALLTSGGQDRLRVIANGNVGIGTSTPTEKLEVAGNIRAANPTAANHVATKNYVDTLVAQGVTWKAPVETGNTITGTWGTCNASKQSWTTYNKNDDIIYICDGNAWISIGSSASVPYATTTSAGKIQISGDLQGTWNTVNLKNNSVDAAAIAANAVGTSEIATDAVVSSKILNNTITASDIGPNAVNASEITDGAVRTQEILDNTITETDISDSFIARSAAKVNSSRTGTSDNGWLDDLNATPRSMHNAGLSFGMVGSANQNAPINYGVLLNVPSYTSGQDGGAGQILFPYDLSYSGNGNPMFRVGDYNNAGWSTWKTFLDKSWGDSLYINIGEGIDGDQINDNTIDSSEIQNDTLTAADLAPNSVGNSELINNPTFTTPTLSSGAPILYFTESDQTDPAGRWRLVADGGSFNLRHRTAAGTWSGEDYTISVANNGNVGIGSTASTEQLNVAGRISLTTDPNSGDDVGDRDYNDGRYFRQQASISSGDFNTLTNQGTYRINDINTGFTNHPAGAYAWGHLNVYKTASNYLVQEYISDNGNHRAWRTQWNGTWRPWKINENLYINVGESGDSIADNTIDSSEIQNNTITNADIADGTVRGTEITDNTITETDISDSFVARNSQLLDGIDGANLMRTDVNDTFIGKLSVGNTNNRRAGMYGIYDSTRVGHIWSIGTAYQIPQDGSNFGNLYGLAYKHTNNPTGGTMAGGHQMVWTQNGTPYASLGTNIWTSGNYIVDNTTVIDSNAWIIGDRIQQNSVDSSEIQNNTITEDDISDSFVARNSQLLDGIDSTHFLRSNTDDQFTGGDLRIERSTTNEIETSGDTSQFEIRQNNSAGDAYMTFHIAGDYALNFGLDGETNELAVGGWSMGANKYRILREGSSGDYIADGTIDSSEIQDNTLTASDLAANSVGNSELADTVNINVVNGISRLDGDYGNIARSYDEWLRLNDSSQHTNGVYVPNMLRADGGLRVSDDEGFYRGAEDVVATDDTLRIRGGSANLQLNDTDNTSFLMHVNSSRLYFMHDANNNLSWDDGEDDRITMYSDGNGVALGIGTSSPALPLHILGAGSDANMRLQNTTSATYWDVNPTNGGLLQLERGGTNYVSFRTNGVRFHNGATQLDDVTCIGNCF